jgi:hypothetical protein
MENYASTHECGTYETEHQEPALGKVTHPCTKKREGKLSRPKEKRSTKGALPPDLSYDTSVMKMELH